MRIIRPTLCLYLHTYPPTSTDNVQDRIKSSVILYHEVSSNFRTLFVLLLLNIYWYFRLPCPESRGKGKTISRLQQYGHWHVSFSASSISFPISIIHYTLGSYLILSCIISYQYEDEATKFSSFSSSLPIFYMDYHNVKSGKDKEREN